jgi:hypothetical protein
VLRAPEEVFNKLLRYGAGVAGGEPHGVDLTDLRALLHGLHAILRLHTIQEDENYLLLSDEAASPAPRSRGPRPPNAIGEGQELPLCRGRLSLLLGTIGTVLLTLSALASQKSSIA